MKGGDLRAILLRVLRNNEAPPKNAGRLMFWEHGNVQQEGERHEVLRSGLLRRAFFNSVNWYVD